jgi:hypothetical protein
MSSTRKVESARANGAKSQGPVTPEGKQSSSLNSLKHGLTARTLVLSNEARERFDGTVEAYLDELGPLTEIETDLVEEMVAAKWRQRRCWVMEKSALDLQMDSQEEELAAKYEKLDEPTRLTIAFQTLAETKGLLTLNRYETGYRREYHKALSTLRDLIRERKNAISRNEPNPISEQVDSVENADSVKNVDSEPRP